MIINFAAKLTGVFTTPFCFIVDQPIPIFLSMTAFHFPIGQGFGFGLSPGQVFGYGLQSGGYLPPSG